MPALAENDFTAFVLVSDLTPATVYHYHWSQGVLKSEVGKTKTLVNFDSEAPWQIAVVSCSSVIAGYFNTYQRISQQEDIDFVLHLGDYIYDYPDNAQLVRVPDKGVLPERGVVGDLVYFRALHKLVSVECIVRFFVLL